MGIPNSPSNGTFFHNINDIIKNMFCEITPSIVIKMDEYFKNGQLVVYYEEKNNIYYNKYLLIDIFNYMKDNKDDSMTRYKEEIKFINYLFFLWKQEKSVYDFYDYINNIIEKSNIQKYKNSHLKMLTSTPIFALDSPPRLALTHVKAKDANAARLAEDGGETWWGMEWEMEMREKHRLRRNFRKV